MIFSVPPPSPPLCFPKGKTIEQWSMLPTMAATLKINMLGHVVNSRCQGWAAEVEERQTEAEVKFVALSMIDSPILVMHVNWVSSVAPCNHHQPIVKSQYPTSFQFHGCSRPDRRGGISMDPLPSGENSPAWRISFPCPQDSMSW